MILKPLAKIHSRGYLLKIGGKEIPFEWRHEYSKDDARPDRQRCIGPNGLELEHDTAMLQHFGVPHPWVRESGTLDGKQVEFFPGGPPDAILIPVYDCILRSCNYYFRDVAQEEHERKYPKGAYTKLPLEYVTNLIDLTEEQQQMLFRSFARQKAGGEVNDPPPPPEPTPEELNNIDELAPPELETLIEKLEAHQQWDKLKHTAREKATWFSNIKQAHQSQRCGYKKPNGSPCGSPAANGDSFCYWHNQSRRLRKLSNSHLLDASNGSLSLAENGSGATSPEMSDDGTFEMPVLEDRLGVQLGIMRVCGLLAAKSIDPYTARVMLYGLRLAQRTLEKDDSLPIN